MREIKGGFDLHMHSRYSDDGEFSPTELVLQCCGAGIRKSWKNMWINS